jgi:hypothetical protein
VKDARAGTGARALGDDLEGKGGQASIVALWDDLPEPTATPMALCPGPPQSSERDLGPYLQLPGRACDARDHSGGGLTDGRAGGAQDLEIEDVERLKAKLDGPAFAQRHAFHHGEVHVEKRLVAQNVLAEAAERKPKATRRGSIYAVNCIASVE